VCAPSGRRVGRSARLAGQGGHAGARLDHVVEGGELGGGAVEPVSGEGDAHELGVVPAQRLVGQPELLDRRGPQVHEQGVGRLHQLTQLRLAFVGGEVDVHAALVAVEACEVHVVLVDRLRADAAGHVALDGFDLDHVRPEVGQHHGAVRSGEQVPDLEDANAGERSRVHYDDDGCGASDSARTLSTTVSSGVPVG
jgi:hypothetical protein